MAQTLWLHKFRESVVGKGSGADVEASEVHRGRSKWHRPRVIHRLAAHVPVVVFVMSQGSRGCLGGCG
jgi:hypothetical protein